MLILFTPWILFIILLITLICLFKKKWLAVFLLITIGVLLNISTKCLPFRLSAVNESDKDKHIGVMSFNMDGMGDNIIQVSQVPNLPVLIDKFRQND